MINQLDLDVGSYDKYIVCFSGGKDSTACFLFLLDHGIPLERIELWHHDIDGFGPQFMDWDITREYCRKFADSFGVRILFQWKKGGFKGEMLRTNSYTASNCFEMLDGGIATVGGKTGKLGTRNKFPQCTMDLRLRWCSAYLKVMVCNAVLCNDKRFHNIRTLILTGERAEESARRANYKVFEPHTTDLRNGTRYQRHIDHLRPIKYWTEKEVWKIIERYGIRSHPCYYLGWKRCSCLFCIFGNADQFKSAAFINPDGFDSIAGYERAFNCSIKRGTDIKTFASKGTVYRNLKYMEKYLALEYDILIRPDEKWIHPYSYYR